MPSSVNPSGKTSALEGVNRVLMALGESPVAAIPVSTDQGLLDLESVLDEATKEIALMGWECNVEYDLAVTVSGGALSLPAGILEMRPEDGTLDLVQRGNAMYDRARNTAVFTNGTVYKMRAIRGLAFNEYPERVQTYIIKEAALRYIMRYKPASDLLAQLVDERDRAKLEAQRHDALSEGWRMSVLSNPQHHETLYRGRRRGWTSEGYYL